MMIHGPCGATNLNAPCMQNGPCNEKFPKSYNNKTFFDSNGHVHYRRKDTGIHITKRELNVDNHYGVPYNHALYLAFQAHINVEYCGWSMLIKYLFKYISKLPDRNIAKITKPIGEASTSTGNQQRINYHGREQLEAIINMPHQKKTDRKQQVNSIAYVHSDAQESSSILECSCTNKGVNLSCCGEGNYQQMIVTKPTRVAYAWLLVLLDNKCMDISHLKEATFQQHSDSFSRNFLLTDIEAILNGFGKSVKDVGLPTPQHLLNDLNNKLLMEENNYKRELLMQEIAHSVPKLKSDQRRIYDLIMNAIEKIVLAVAIIQELPHYFCLKVASLYAQFLKCVELTERIPSSLIITRQLGNLLAETDFIFWDEAPMNDRRCFETLDRTLKDLMNAPYFLFNPRENSHFRRRLYSTLQFKTKELDLGDKRNRNALSDGILKHHEIPRISATRARTKGWITDHATAKCQSVRRFIQRYKI
ncbi:DNA helicase [Tanacetum coccineum]